jgi:hypothetical protein
MFHVGCWMCMRGWEVGSSTKWMHLKVPCLCKEIQYDENGNQLSSTNVSFPPKNRKKGIFCHKFVCIWRYILQNYNYKLLFQNLLIYDISHVSIGTLVVENIDVCTTCDREITTYNWPWEETKDNKYTPTLLNVWPWRLLIVIANATRTGNWWWRKTNGQLVPEGDMMMRGMNTRLPTLFPVMISTSMTH